MRMLLAVLITALMGLLISGCASSSLVDVDNFEDTVLSNREKAYIRKHDPVVLHMQRLIHE